MESRVRRFEYLSPILLTLAITLNPHITNAQPIESWVNACEANTPDQDRLLAATALIVPTHTLTNNGDGTWQLANSDFTNLDPTHPVCSNSNFYGEKAAIAGRTGVLVGTDLVLTTPHGNNSQFNSDQRAVIFGLRSTLSTGPTQTCVQPDYDRIPADNIYFPPKGDYFEIVSNTKDPVATDADYIVLRMTRPVSNIDPIRVRRTGGPEVLDEALAVGHPHRLSSKVDHSLLFSGPRALSVGLAQGVGVYGLNVYSGSSGSPVYNVERQILELSVALTLPSSGYKPDYSQSPTCWYAAQSGSAEKSSNQSVSTIAAHIPAKELLVAPLDRIVYRAPTTTPISPQVTSYTLSASSALYTNLTYSISAPTYTEIPNPGSSPPTTPPPMVTTSIAPGVYTLTPGQSTTLNITAPSLPSATCRRWRSTVEVNDLTNGWRDQIEHQFEIGSVEYQVEGDHEISFEEIVPPYSASTAYIVRNVRPVRVKAVVNTSAPWITLDISGGTSSGTTATVWLEPMGTAGDSATVTASLVDSEARLLVRHTTHTAEIQFSYASTCAVAPVSRMHSISFHPGRKTYETDWVSTGPEVPDSPGGGIPGAPFAGSLAVNAPSDFCVSKLGVRIGFDGNGSFVVPFPALMQELEVDIASPAWEEPLWYKNVVPSSHIDHKFVGAQLFDAVRIEDALAPPPIGTLSNFYGRRGKGTWTMYLLDVVNSGYARIQPRSLELFIEGEPGCP